jgi:cell division protein FtsQ
MNDDPRPRRLWRWVAAAAVATAVLASPWWGPRALRHLSFFRVRHVEIVGATYVPAGDIVGHLGVDTTSSIWDDLDPLANRVRRLPEIREVELSRKLPGTLVVRIHEKQPVALVAAPGGFRAYDATGALLPIDPSRSQVDLPLLATRDTALLRLLANVRADVPALYARISEVRRVSGDELLIHLTSVPVRAPADVTVGRLAETIPVEDDLARRHARVAELDLRYRDQVVARLQ